MPRLYLDIDGVLLTKHRPTAAAGASEFIEYAMANFDCYWLTTHCKGNAATAVAYLRPYFDPHTVALLLQIKPTTWDALKTEGIDLASDFYWLEDAPLNAEMAFLKHHGKQDQLILVDLSQANELQRVAAHLQQAK